MKKPAHVVLGADHAGYALKEVVEKYLISQKIDVLDEGTFSSDPIDYPAIMRRACARGLEVNAPIFLFGGSGNGEAMAANKVHGIRAALCYSEETARLARQHNDANACAVGARLTGEDITLKIVDTFLSTEFEGGRHEKRVRDLE